MKIVKLKFKKIRLSNNFLLIVIFINLMILDNNYICFAKVSSFNNNISIDNVLNKKKFADKNEKENENKIDSNNLITNEYISKEKENYKYLVKGVNFIYKENYDKAIYFLEKINVSSPYFFVAYKELIKILYKIQDWPKFFAYIRFYRNKILKNEKYKVKFFDQDIISLEMLGLARNCMWEEVKALFKQTKLFIKNYKIKEYNNIRQTAILLNLKHQSDFSLITKSSKLDMFTSEKVFWPVKKSSFSNISHPRNMRIFLAKNCPEKKDK